MRASSRGIFVSRSPCVSRTRAPLRRRSDTVPLFARVLCLSLTKNELGRFYLYPERSQCDAWGRHWLEERKKLIHHSKYFTTFFVCVYVYNESLESWTAAPEIVVEFTRKEGLCAKLPQPIREELFRYQHAGSDITNLICSTIAFRVCWTLKFSLGSSFSKY